MITIKLTPQKTLKEVEWEEGMTVEDVLENSNWTESSVRVLMNGSPVGKDKELNDGDRVTLVPVVGGGNIC